MSFFSVVFNLGTNVAVLLLLSIGLALIYATRGIINLAHGEFVMLGAYATLQLAANGLPVVLAVVTAVLLLAAFGAVVERLLIRRLYGRTADAMIATWGLSLILIQVITLIFGTNSPGLEIPFGAFRIGSYTASLYSVVLIAVAAGVLVGIFLLMRRTSFGLRARATARAPQMAEAVGINTSRVDTVTFAIGAGTAGLAGGVLAPYLGVSPTMGQNFIAEVFMTVIVGGANFVLGTPAAAALLGGSESLLAGFFSPINGQVGLLLLAILIVRLRPMGLTKVQVRR
jgi:urea transport system permease protein